MQEESLITEFREWFVEVVSAWGIDDRFKQETKSKVLTLTHEEFIIENEDGKGKLMKMYGAC